MENFLEKIEKRNFSKRAIAIGISFILMIIASITTAIIAYSTGAGLPLGHGVFGHMGLRHSSFLQIASGGSSMIWLAVLSLMWTILGIFYWVTVIEWLYKTAKIHNLNTALWPLLGVFFNILAVFAIMIVINQPKKCTQAPPINNTTQF